MNALQAQVDEIKGLLQTFIKSKQKVVHKEDLIIDWSDNVSQEDSEKSRYASQFNTSRHEYGRTGSLKSVVRGASFKKSTGYALDTPIYVSDDSEHDNRGRNRERKEKNRKTFAKKNKNAFRPQLERSQLKRSHSDRSRSKSSSSPSLSPPTLEPSYISYEGMDRILRNALRVTHIIFFLFHSCL